MTRTGKKMQPTTSSKISETKHHNGFKRASFSRGQLVAIVVAFSLVGGYVLTKSFAEEPALTHTNNTIINFRTNKEKYIIEDNKLRFVSDQVFESYGYNPSEVRTATDGDKRLPIGTPLELAEGAIIKNADKQYITVKSNGVVKKRLIKSNSLLDQLNAQTVNTVTVNQKQLPKEDALPLTDSGTTESHPNGMVLLSGSGLNYLIQDGVKRPIKTYSAYRTNKIDQKSITTENEADKKLPIGEPLELKEGTLIKGSGSTDYVIERLKNRAKTLVKRPIRSDEALLGLGYSKKEVLRIPDSEVLAIPDGSPIPESASTPVVILVSLKKGANVDQITQDMVNLGGQLRLKYSDWFSMSMPIDKVDMVKQDSRVNSVEGNAVIAYIPCDPGDYCGPVPPPPPPPPPTPPPPPPPAGSNSPYISTWLFNGTNSWTYNVSNASNCEVHLSGGGIQPFTPSLGSNFPVSAGNGGNDGQLWCWNNGIGPVTSGWAGPSGNPNPPAPPGQLSPSIVLWQFNSGNVWNYSVKNSTYCEVKLSNNAIQPFTPTNDGTFSVSAGNGGMQGQLSCWNNSIGPATSAMVGPTAPPPAPPPPPPPGPSSYPPLNDWPPTISGTAVVGSVLTTDSGTWKNGVTSFNYLWQRCSSIDSQGYPVASSCVNANPFSSSTYTVGSGMVGYRIAVKVTATNSAGSSSVYSKATPVVPGSTPAPASYPPLNDYPPSISGSAITGSTLTTDNGTWKNGVTSFVYLWQRCSSVDSSGYPVASSCSNASPTNSSSYNVVSADQGFRIAVKVTATNSAGSASAYSKATAVVTAPSSTPVGSCTNPTNLTAPTLSGTYTVNGVVTTTKGTWNANCSNASLSYYYEWWRCTNNTDINSCSYWPKPPFMSYTNKITLNTDDLNKNIRSSVTVCHSNGCSTKKYSNASIKVTSSSTPVPPVVPTITTFTSSPASPVTAGTQVKLTWSSSNTTKCTGTSLPTNATWNNISATTGNLNVGALSVTTKFTLQCTNGSSSVIKDLNITVNSNNPTPTPTPTPTPSPTTSAGPVQFRRINWTNRGAGVPVAVLDTGLSSNPTVRQYIRNVGEGYNCVSNNTNTEDDHGHGTTVSSVIAAQGGDGINTPLGIAPGTQIIPIKIADSNGSSNSEGWNCGLREAQARGATVVNISMVGSPLGSGVDGNSCSGFDGTYERLCSYPGIVIGAAGNGTIDFSNLALTTHPRLLTVTAMHDADGKPGGVAKDAFTGLSANDLCGQADDRPATYSNFDGGSEADHTIAAPSCFLVIDRGGNISRGAGTSYAAPVVSAMSALCNGCRPNSSSDPAYTYIPISGRNYGPLVRF